MHWNCCCALSRMLKVLKCYSAILISSFSFNQASSKQNLERSSSSEDEDENVTSNQKVSRLDHYCVLKRQHNAGNSYCTACVHIFWSVLYSLCQLCPERQRRKQEKTIAQQAKREQLKRLHRAQVLLSHSDPTNGSCCWHVQGLGIMYFYNCVSTSQNVWNIEKDWQNPQCPLSVTSLTALKKSSDGWIRLFSFNRVIFFSFLFSYNMNAVSLLLYVRFIFGVLVHFFKKTLI